MRMMTHVAARSKWMLRISAAIAVLGLAVLAAPSRAQAQVSLFGGYSYLRASVPVGQFSGTPPALSQNANLANGWEVSAKYSFFPLLGAVADFGGNYGTLDGATVRVNTYMFGPQLSLPGRISPFVHVLVGFAHEQQDAFASPSYFSLGSDTSFATAIGGGIDVKVVPFVAVRLIQVDYLRTSWHGMSQNQPRVSAGIVLHF
jgi:hypothetical protein